MDSKASSSLLFIALFFFFSSTSSAFNITKILSNYPDFSTFSDLLNQTGLAKEINTRQTITVLAVSNGNIDAISGRPLDIVKRILSAHVILDYYDKEKLSKIQKKSSILTTLYQTTGTADDQQGFLNVTKTPEGIMFGSAAKGAPLTATLEGAVAAQPYNISVLKVSGLIEAPGIDSATSPPPSPAAAKAPKKAPAPSAKTPTKAPAPAAEEPSADSAPTDAPTDAPADAPADGPAADGPAADSPLADGPGSSSPEADSPAADADAPSSSSSRLNIGGYAVLVGLIATVMGV